ncbi:hypothetical protein DI09_13p100 [Mitosporidium daphniae]|uniref:Uncharacterized protein n=1 Tax=Mitosporidium daphniae TaxID=1485682 RepID=A0A098VY67_9MICR|nr:uncharacterized protein DI09_13p100 [Mitosporidium daphniae]KGG52721.1 hypothetical protein DI09_13p100 [Mitosporidium daphniae]|eukprot:XP_013239148.1 uncharacterized protein DI09_13p100 [Mitosporidium daphniae]
MEVFTDSRSHVQSTCTFLFPEFPVKLNEAILEQANIRAHRVQLDRTKLYIGSHFTCRFIKYIDLLDGIDHESDAPPILYTPKKMSRIKLTVKTPTSGPSSPRPADHQGIQGLQFNPLALVSFFGCRSCIYILVGISEFPLLGQHSGSAFQAKASCLRFEFDELSSPTSLRTKALRI